MVTIYCHTIFWFSGVWICYLIEVLSQLVSGEIYLRVCHTPKRLRRSASVGIAIIAILVFLVGVSLAATGTYLALDYDYCERRHFGNYYFRNSTSIGIHGISFLFTMYTLIASSIQIRRQHLLQPRYRKSAQYHRDVSMVQLNFMAYLMHVTFWIPHLIVVNVFPSAPDAWYYPTAWAGVSRPLFTSMFYGSLNRMFGRAYSNIFNYCCCKSSMHSYPRRQRRAFEYYARPVNSDVRIHILQHALNIHGPQRASSSTQETTELWDVYEPEVRIVYGIDKHKNNDLSMCMNKTWASRRMNKRIRKLAKAELKQRETAQKHPSLKNVDGN